ncbi:MAG: ABC transporter permease [Peptococcaceae bacterium]|jgi:simple sugar transport system permease protein|nr:ABC transporter permease [Peptococcaceae bacterium]
MNEQILQQVGSLLAGTIRVFTPITFAAIASSFSARAGVVNMALDGIMLIGAFFAVFGSFLTGSAWLGLALGIFASVLIALFFAALTITFRCDQALAGLGINLLAKALTIVLLQAVWNTKGKSAIVNGIEMIRLDALKSVPLLGDMFSETSPLLIILLLSLICVYILFFKTVFGMRMQVTGENPAAARSLGIKVERAQYLCVMISGVFAALGGAYLSICDVNVFSRDMVAGRGFIGMAVSLFGANHPIGCLLGGLLFGFTQSLQYRLQGIGIPNQLIQMMPYVLTLVALVFSKRDTSALTENQL